MQKVEHGFQVANREISFGNVCMIQNCIIFFHRNSCSTFKLSTACSTILNCIAVWGSCSLSLFSDLEHLHIKAAKLIHKLPSGTLDCDALKRAKWKPLSYIYKRRLASIMYQVHNDILPVQLTALLGTRSNETSYKLRRSNDFSLVRYHSELGRNSIRDRGPL